MIPNRESRFKRCLQNAKETCRQWSMSSTAQCLPKVFQYENTYIKIVWSLIFIVFSVATDFFFIQGIFDFLEFDVVSKIRVYNEQTLVYPVVTLCDANVFTTKEAGEIFEKIQFDFENIWNILDPKNTLQNQSIQNSISRNFYALLYGFSKAFEMNDEQKKKLGFSLDQSLKACSFNAENCDASNFSWFFDNMYGNCFQFNTGEKLKSTQLSGFSYGLNIYLGNLRNENKYPTFFAKGLRVFVHNTSFLSSSSEQVLIETGKYTNVVIKKTLTYRTPQPYSECNDLTDYNSDLLMYMKSVKRFYRQNDCFELCLQNMVIRECGCFFPGITSTNENKSLKPCFTFNETTCSFQVFTNNSKEVGKLCGNECPLECDYIKYELATSSLEYPSEEFFGDLKIHSKNEYENMSLEEL